MLSSSGIFSDGKLKGRGKNDLKELRTDSVAWKCCLGILLLLALGMAGFFHHQSYRPEIKSPFENGGPLSNLNLPGSSTTKECVVPASLQPTINSNALVPMSRSLGSARLLGIEVGENAPYWLASNCRGQTLFVNHPDDKVDEKHHDVQEVTRSMRIEISRTEALAMVNNEVQLTKLFDAHVPAEALHRNWEEILVEGSIAKAYLSVYVARRLASPNTIVFVDNCEDEVRSAFVKRWFENDGWAVKRYANGRAGTVCGLGPLQKGMMHNGKNTSPFAVLAIIALLVLYAAVMVCLRMNAMNELPGASATPVVRSPFGVGRGSPQHAQNTPAAVNRLLRVRT